MNSESRRQPSREEMKRWAIHQQTLTEWRRVEVREPRWERISKAGDMVQKCLASVLPGDELPCAELVSESWERAAGSFNAIHARPSGWQSGDLIIEVDHPSLRFELMQHRSKLLQRMRDELEPTKVRGLRFRLVG